MTDSTRSEVDADEVRRLWDSKASYWDQRFGEGNVFHKGLIEPAVLRLLEPQSGWTVLDIATGNGAFARRLAQDGISVVAFDFSRVFLERARQRGQDLEDWIEYHCIDASNREELLALGSGRFDAAVAIMALMDMPEIDVLAETLVDLLKPNGRFVFAVQHPCFNSNAVSIVAETGELQGRMEVHNSMKIHGYLQVPPGLGGGMPGEPNPHYYFHRPLHELFDAFFREGFAITGLEEPTFEPGGQPLNWSGVGGQIPPILAVRMQLLPELGR